MDRNTVIGFVLIFAILIVWQLTLAPDPADVSRQTEQLDSLRTAGKERADSLAALPLPAELDTTAVAAQDIDGKIQLAYGPFAAAARGEERFITLENDVMRMLLSSKGGRIVEVELKHFYKMVRDSNHKEHKIPLKLLDDPKDRFEYLLPVANVPSGAVSTADLYFESEKSSDGKSVVFRAPSTAGGYFEQRYTLREGSYGIDYHLAMPGLSTVLDKSREVIPLRWRTYLDKLELNHQYERTYSTIYFKPADDDYDYCSCTSDDTEDLSNRAVEWVAHSNQFFASVLMARSTPFAGASMAVHVLDEKDEDLKQLQSAIEIPASASEFSMEFYVGPKDFETLRAYGNQLEDIIPFGRSIIGAANRWVIRPLFNFLTSLIGIKGLAIIILTLLVKLALYPLTYKMLYSQAKMSVLKPQLEALRKKYKDDQTQIQMETMKLYREFGVNPLGGCLPVVLQMPIWFALYRFFPASIEFRQVGFLWATDLSSYDAAFWLPFEIPFYGQHVSLFTLLWVVSTIAYTHYNMKVMDMSSMGGANAQMMKWMQYLMPVFFLFFFNNFASGLTCYLVFSNLINIAQTVVTKNYIIDHDKIMQEMEAYRKKPKKKGGFQSRLEEALKQQQAMAAQRQAAAKNKKK
ncbi:MAG: membrane protein insertase YidC [Saprospiraceae bacterium]|nr:MAG: membrane protein insertase YidC [Saprospiraceae bacterium]